MFYGIKMEMHTLIKAFGETYFTDFVGCRFERFLFLSFWGSALQALLYSNQSISPSVPSLCPSEITFFEFTKFFCT